MVGHLHHSHFYEMQYWIKVKRTERERLKGIPLYLSYSWRSVKSQSNYVTVKYHKILNCDIMCMRWLLIPSINF